MKQTTFENIKQMDISLGGGISSEKIRIDTINHPVLVIGLGGTGTDALLRLKYQINRRFKLPDNPITKQKKPKPDNIEFLALETNEHDKKRYKGISLDSNTEMVLLSNAAIGSILNNRSTLPDYIKSWLSPGLTITDGTKGASGNRQAGRLLLFEKINTTIDAIENKIRTLRGDQENKLLVFILSGLSGGTGGGMFLDIAYIIRGLMEREYGSKGVDKVEIGGYLFTPDVNLSGNNLNIHTEEYIQRNGYAALKELDYWMNLEERQGERFCQKYGTRLEVASPLAPFNLCHLVSASNIDGMFLKGAYDYCMNVTAENIVNFLALEEKESGQEFAIQDYYSNLLTNISTMKSNLPPGMPHAANFVYNIIGASAAVLPTEDINAYLAYGLFRQIAPMFDATPDDHDLNQFVQATKLDIISLGAELAQTLPPIKLDFAGTDYFSHQNVIKTQRVSIDEKLTDLYNQAKRELTKGRKLNIFGTIKSELNATFTNPTQGPIYTSRLISATTNPCLLSRLEACQQHLREKIHTIAQEIDGLELAAESRFLDATKAIFLTKEQKKNAYIEAKIKVYQARLQKDCFAALIDVYKELHTALSAENDKIYTLYTEILKEINRTLTNNAKFLCQPVKIESQKSYYWDVINVTDAVLEIDNILEKAGVDILIKEFAKTLLEDSARLLNDNQLNITGAVSDFIYDQFGSFISRSMSEFLGLKFGRDRIVEHIVEAEIAPRLYRDAKPVFNMDNAAGLFNFPSYGMVSVPWNTPDILRGIEAYQQHALANLPFNIRKSNITDRIFWLNTQNGIPLFAYTPIRVYEELYERTINTREGIGRHLVMTEAESWVNLPSPIPEGLWGDTYSNQRQKSLNDEAREVFANALTNGVVCEQDGQYVYLQTEHLDTSRYNFDIKTDLKEIYNALDELTAMRICSAQPSNCKEHLTQCHAGLPIIEKRVIFTTQIESEACDHFIRNRSLIALAKSENAKYAKLSRKIEELRSLLAENENEKGQIDEFLRTITCEAIVKRGAYYIFDKELEDDPWPPFVNLIEQAEYPEYTMFEAYKSLSIDRQKTLRKKAKLHEETWQGDKLLINLKKWQGKVAVRKNQLDKDMWKYPNGTKIYGFYRNVLLRLNSQVSAVEG